MHLRLPLPGVGHVLLALLVCTSVFGAGCGSEDANKAKPGAQKKAIDPGVRIEAAEANRFVLVAQNRIVGRVFPWRASAVVAAVGGTLKKRNAENGETVTGDQPLLWLDSTRQRLGVDTAKIAVASRASERSYADQERARIAKLQLRSAASKFQLDQATQALERASLGVDQANVQLRSARRQLSDTTLLAPHSGVIHQIAVDVGDAVAPGRPLAEVVDLTRVRIRAGVRAQVAARLTVGAQIPFVVDVIDGQTRNASLATVGPRADPRTGLFEIELHADNPGSTIKGGMSAVLDISAPTSPTLVVPSSALTRREGTIGVFAIRSTDTGQVAAFSPVVTGQRARGFTEIIDGLSAKTLVATSGLNALASGTKVIVTKVARLPAAPARSPSIAPGDAQPLTTTPVQSAPTAATP